MDGIGVDRVVGSADGDGTDFGNARSFRKLRLQSRPWWLVSLIAGSALSAVFALCALGGAGISPFEQGTTAWWVATTALHAPYVVILSFLLAGLVERIGYFRLGRAPEPAGRLPAVFPTVCVQLPMFNEHAVAQRVIEAASAMSWPRGRLTVQVLDDSTDPDTRALVEETCERVGTTTGVHCYVLHRTDRQGYKAGALEEGRRATDAEFLAIFDSDFVPPKDFLVRTIPHFYSHFPDGEPDHGLALVQTQWGHLNHDQSALTLAQSLWVDDHHTLQMAWRSAKWKFVNFTGTAGVWRAAAIDAVGGWRAASLVEDCELSFRHLFAGYRTKFVKEIVVPAELPATYTAYKAQQRRWTRGWVQLQRLHLGALLFGYRCSPLRRLHLTYHMCISWQWPAWAIWTVSLPLIIYTGHWFGSLGTAWGVLFYLVPTALFAVLAATVASVETRHTYPGRLTVATFCRRLQRMVPYLVVNTGMLPHQFSSVVEGLFGPMHGEFERTPKAASVGGTSVRVTPETARRYTVRIHWPYVLTEAFFIGYQLASAVLLASGGLAWCAVGAAYLATCVAYVAFFYGDHAGKVAFIFEKRIARVAAPARDVDLRGRTLALLTGGPRR